LAANKELDELLTRLRDDKSLQHVGVKGMKWGKRNSQKRLGKATSKSMADDELKAKVDRLNLEKNYDKLSSDKNDKSISKSSFETGATAAKEAGNVLSTINRRKENELSNKKREEAKQLSDKDLKDKINRLNMEQQYRNLTTKDVDVGKSRVEDFLSISGSVLTVAAAGAGLALTVRQLMNKV